MKHIVRTSLNLAVAIFCGFVAMKLGHHKQYVQMVIMIIGALFNLLIVVGNIGAFFLNKEGQKDKCKCPSDYCSERPEEWK